MEKNFCNYDYSEERNFETKIIQNKFVNKMNYVYKPLLSSNQIVFTWYPALMIMNLLWVNNKILNKQFEINRFNKLLFNRKFLNNTGLLFSNFKKQEPIEIKISYWI